MLPLLVNTTKVNRYTEITENVFDRVEDDDGDLESWDNVDATRER